MVLGDLPPNILEDASDGKSEACRLKALRALREFSFKSENRVPMFRDTKGCLKTLLEAAAPDQAYDVRKEALRALTNLTVALENMVPMMQNKDCIARFLVAALPEQPIGIRESALKALANISVAPENKVPMFTDTDGCMARILVGASVSEPLGIRKQAIRALSSLAVAEENMVPMFGDKKGCMMRLLMGASSEQPVEVREKAIKGLANLSTIAENKVPMFRDAEGCLRRLLEAASAGQPEVVREEALRALSSLTVAAENRFAMFRNFQNCMTTLLEGASATKPVSIRKPALIALANLAVHVKTKTLASFYNPVDKLLPTLNHVNGCLERLVAGARPDQPEDIRKVTLLGLVHLTWNPVNRPAMLALGVRELLEGASKKETFHDIYKHLIIGVTRLKGVSAIRPLTAEQHQTLVTFLDSHSLQKWTVPNLVAKLGPDVAVESLQNHVEKYKSYLSCRRYQQGFHSPIIKRLDLIGYEPGGYNTSAKTRSAMHSDSSDQIYVLPRNVPTMIFLSVAVSNVKKALPGVIFELDFQSEAFVDAYHVAADLDLGEKVPSHLLLFKSPSEGEGVKVIFGSSRPEVEKVLGDAIESKPSRSMVITSTEISTSVWVSAVFGIVGKTNELPRFDGRVDSLGDSDSSTDNLLINSIFLVMFIFRRIGAGEVMDLSENTLRKKMKQLGFNDSISMEIAAKWRQLWVAFLLNTPENEMKPLANTLALEIKLALEQYESKHMKEV